MSNITITHAKTGALVCDVLRTEQISPNFVRVTLTGDGLRNFESQGFDQWFRLVLPVSEETHFDRLPEKADTKGYLKFLLLPKATRPVIRNYTVREFRAESLELDVDFVVHGTEGIAGPWAASAQPGAQVALFDQGCGWKAIAADSYLLVADETGLPAVAGVLRDMPRDAVGHAIIEVRDSADAQDTGAPHGMTVHWVTRTPGARPGSDALAAAQAPALGEGAPYVYVVGESALATGLRRWAVSEKGIAKSNVTFCGYWKLGG